jgi:hypothetical protein
VCFLHNITNPKVPGADLRTPQGIAPEQRLKVNTGSTTGLGRADGQLAGRHRTEPVD